MMVMMGVL